MLSEIGKIVHGIKLRFVSFFLSSSIFLLFTYSFLLSSLKKRGFNKKEKKKIKRKKKHLPFLFLAFLSFTAFLCSALKLFSLFF